jgi:hypothetical protein
MKLGGITGAIIRRKVTKIEKNGAYVLVKRWALKHVTRNCVSVQYRDQQNQALFRNTQSMPSTCYPSTQGNYKNTMSPRQKIQKEAARFEIICPSDLNKCEKTQEFLEQLYRKYNVNNPLHHGKIRHVLYTSR